MAKEIDYRRLLKKYLRIKYIFDEGLDSIVFNEPYEFNKEELEVLEELYNEIAIDVGNDIALEEID